MILQEDEIEYGSPRVGGLIGGTSEAHNSIVGGFAGNTPYKNLRCA